MEVMSRLPEEKRKECQDALNQYEAILLTGSATVTKTEKSFKDFLDSLKQFQQQLTDRKNSYMSLAYFVPVRLSDDDLKNVGLNQ